MEVFPAIYVYGTQSTCHAYCQMGAVVLALFSPPIFRALFSAKQPNLGMFLILGTICKSGGRG